MTKEKAYRHQMDGAKGRGIPWEFTIETWWAVWEKSGKWEQRGRGMDKFVMGRFGDIGPYSPSNVYICTGLDNRRDSANNMQTKEWAAGRAPKRVYIGASDERVARYVNNISPKISSPIIERVYFDESYCGPSFFFL